MSLNIIDLPMRNTKKIGAFHNAPITRGRQNLRFQYRTKPKSVNHVICNMRQWSNFRGKKVGRLMPIEVQQYYLREKIRMSRPSKRRAQ